jgi:EAL domain-containing protein (putative c-di-GMP-specific phosphodiesterase class I)
LTGRSTSGLRSPDVSIPLAEPTGLAEPLTRVVLRQALAACGGWRDDGLDITVAVKLSAKNLSNQPVAAAVPRQPPVLLRAATA